MSIVHIFAVFLYPLKKTFFYFIGGGTFCKKMCTMCTILKKNKKNLYIKYLFIYLHNYDNKKTL